MIEDMTWQWMMVIITLIIMASVVLITLHSRIEEIESLKRSLRKEEDKNDMFNRQIYDLRRKSEDS